VLLEHDIKPIVLHKRWKLDPWAMLSLSREFNRQQPQIVHSWLFAANSYVRLISGNKPSYKRVVSERCVDTWKAGWQTWLDRKLISRTEILLGNSQSVCEFYKQLGYQGDKVLLIHNAVPDNTIIPYDKAEFLRGLQLPEDAKLVACVGRLAPQKRIADLLWGIQLLRQLDPRCYLLVIGEGELKAELELLSHDLECTEHVRFMGHRADVAQILPLTDIFWLASEFEGQSNSLLEAMQAGIPVVVSDIPANRELIRHGENGYTVKLGDSPGFSQYAWKLLQEPELAESLTNNAQTMIKEQFSLKKMIMSHVKLYQSLCT
jgi:glycosyltransferase involved in cell wall biosynthesis